MCSNLPVEVLKGEDVIAVSTTLSETFPCKTSKDVITKSCNI